MTALTGPRLDGCRLSKEELRKLFCAQECDVNDGGVDGEVSKVTYSLITYLAGEWNVADYNANNSYERDLKKHCKSGYV